MGKKKPRDKKKKELEEFTKIFTKDGEKPDFVVSNHRLYKRLGHRIANGEWDEFGVETLEDFYQRCNINKYFSKYTTEYYKEKLDQFIEIIKTAVQKDPNFDLVKHPLYNSIKGNIVDKQWTSFGVKKVEDFRVRCGLLSLTARKDEFDWIVADVVKKSKEKGFQKTKYNHYTKILWNIESGNWAKHPIKIKTLQAFWDHCGVKSIDLGNVKEVLDKITSELKDEMKDPQFSIGKFKHASRISYNISKGNWVEFGIVTREDFYDRCGYNYDIDYLAEMDLVADTINKDRREEGFILSDHHLYPTIQRRMRGAKWPIKTYPEFYLRCGLIYNVNDYKEILPMKRKDLLSEYQIVIQELKRVKDEPIFKINEFKYYVIVRNRIEDGKWQRFGIHHITQFWKENGVKIKNIRDDYAGKEGLDIVKSEFKEFYSTYEILPYTRKFSFYATLVRDQFWEKQGIHVWDDLLRYCGFAEINEFDYLNYTPDEKGLMKAKTRAIEKSEHGKINSMKIPFVYNRVSNGYWKKYKMQSWSDFLEYCGLKSSTQYRHEAYYYHGKIGLKRAISDFQMMVDAIGYIPAAKSCMMASIYPKIQENHWDGIMSYAEFIITSGYVPDQVNVSFWFKPEGKAYADNFLIDKMKKEQRIVRTDDHIASGLYQTLIKNSLLRKKWKVKDFWSYISQLLKKMRKAKSMTSKIERSWKEKQVDLDKIKWFNAKEKAIKHIKGVMEAKNRVVKTSDDGIERIRSALKNLKTCDNWKVLSFWDLVRDILKIMKKEGTYTAEIELSWDDQRQRLKGWGHNLARV